MELSNEAIPRESYEERELYKCLLKAKMTSGTMVVQQYHHMDKSFEWDGNIPYLNLVDS